MNVPIILQPLYCAQPAIKAASLALIAYICRGKDKQPQHLKPIIVPQIYVNFCDGILRGNKSVGLLHQLATKRN
jgi:hypothetical protein